MIKQKYQEAFPEIMLSIKKEVMSKIERHCAFAQMTKSPLSGDDHAIDQYCDHLDKSINDIRAVIAEYDFCKDAIIK